MGINKTSKIKMIFETDLCIPLSEAPLPMLKGIDVCG
jgi:hypothetical protein